MARLTCGPGSSAIGERGEGGVRALLGQKVGWSNMPKGRRGASHGGRWERAYAVEPEEGAARARLQGEGREKGQVGQKPGKETFSFDFVFLLFQNFFQNFSKEFEFILNFSRNHSSQ